MDRYLVGEFLVSSSLLFFLWYLSSSRPPFVVASGVKRLVESELELSFFPLGFAHTSSGDI